MFNFRSIKFRMFVFLSTIISLVIVCSFSILYWVLPNYYYYSKSKNLEQSTDELIEKIESLSEMDAIANEIRAFYLTNNTNVIMYDNAGNVVDTSSALFIIRDETNWGVAVAEDLASSETSMVTGSELKINIQSDLEDLQEQLEFYAISTTQDFDVTDATQPRTVEIILEDIRQEYLPATNGKVNDGNIFLSINRPVENELISQLNVMATLQPIEEAQKVVLSLIPYMLLITVIIALSASYIYADRFTRPVIKLSNTADEMSRFNRNITANIKTGDELETLSNNMDHLYQNLCNHIDMLKVEMNRVKSLELSKTEFMQSASHELKTPIAALNGIVEGMIDKIGIYQDRDKYLLECKRLIDSFTSLVNEIINASKHDNEIMAPTFTDVEIRSILISQIENYRPMFEDKNINLSYTISDKTVFGDEVLYSRIFSNLLSNALKYTQEGGWVDIVSAESADGYTIYFQNKTVPLNQRDLEKLFEPFYTGEYSRSSKQKGTGLGLYIVSQNANRLGISYKAENVNDGLRITLVIN